MAMCMLIAMMVVMVVTVIVHSVSLKGNEAETWRPHPLMQVRLLLIGRCALGFATRIGFLFFFLAFVRCSAFI